jgi:hypothetical protein
MTETRICKYEPCSKEFEPTHPRQIFCEPTCRTNQHYLDHPEKGRSLQGGALRSVATHPLVEARAEQEASDLNSQLGQIVHQAIIDRLVNHGEVHADDLEGYFPAEHLDRCRKLIGGQFGSLAGRHYIKGIAYRKSTVPARKGGKSWVYIFTEKGRDTLVGVGSDNREGISATATPGDTSSGTLDRPRGGIHTAKSARSSLAAPSGESSTESRDQADPSTYSPVDATPGAASPDQAPGAPVTPAPGASTSEPLSLLPDVPSMFDPDQRAA